MVSEQDAQQVIDALNGAQMADRVLTVKKTEDKPVPASNFQEPQNLPPKIFTKIPKPGVQTRAKRPRRPMRYDDK